MRNKIAIKKREWLALCFVSRIERCSQYMTVIVYIIPFGFKFYLDIMMFWGTANPTGEHESYDGLYLKKHEINNMVLDRDLIGLPVKIEHKGDQIGHVVSAWQHEGRLDMLLSINDKNSLQSNIGSTFVKTGVCSELSLGYSVSMQNSKETGLKTGVKTVKEVSIVKQGARDNCIIHNFFQS